MRFLKISPRRRRSIFNGIALTRRCSDSRRCFTHSLMSVSRRRPHRDRGTVSSLQKVQRRPWQGKVCALKSKGPASEPQEESADEKHSPAPPPTPLRLLDARVGEAAQMSYQEKYSHWRALLLQPPAPAARHRKEMTALPLGGRVCRRQGPRRKGDGASLSRCLSEDLGWVASAQDI